MHNARSGRGIDATACPQVAGTVSRFMRVHRKPPRPAAQDTMSEKKKKRPAQLVCRTPQPKRLLTQRYGFVDLSTLLPMIPPRIAPAAPPMIAPFTLFRLLTAPITAPAPAPMAASRLVCFTTVGCGAGAGA